MCKSKGNSIPLATTEQSMSAPDSLTSEHPPKRLTLYSEEDTVLNDEEYEEAVQALQDEYNNKTKKKVSNHKVVKDLMEKTKKQRHQWICQERPMITEVLEKFPVLRTSRWVR